MLRIVYYEEIYITFIRVWKDLFINFGKIPINLIICYNVYELDTNYKSNEYIRRSHLSFIPGSLFSLILDKILRLLIAPNKGRPLPKNGARLFTDPKLFLYSNGRPLLNRLLGLLLKLLIPKQLINTLISSLANFLIVFLFESLVLLLAEDGLALALGLDGRLEGWLGLAWGF